MPPPATPRGTKKVSNFGLAWRSAARVRPWRHLLRVRQACRQAAWPAVPDVSPGRQPGAPRVHVSPSSTCQSMCPRVTGRPPQPRSRPRVTSASIMSTCHRSSTSASIMSTCHLGLDHVHVSPQPRSCPRVTGRPPQPRSRGQVGSAASHRSRPRQKKRAAVGACCR